MGSFSDGNPCLMLQLSSKVAIPANELEFSAIRAQGPGGQNVNKVANAVHLRFDIRASSLPDFYKERLLALHDQRITHEGVIVIKAQQYRSLEQNQADALARLKALILDAVKVAKKRKATKPTRSSQRKRLESKSRHGATKRLRGKIGSND